MVWGVIVIGGIDNVLSPRLVGRRARLHELLIFFAVLGGLQVFGVLGLVLGPVVVAMTLALIEMARQAGHPPSETLPQANGHGGAVEPARRGVSRSGKSTFARCATVDNLRRLANRPAVAEAMAGPP